MDAKAVPFVQLPPTRLTVFSFAENFPFCFSVQPSTVQRFNAFFTRLMVETGWLNL
jgi:hypothetical protein